MLCNIDKKSLNYRKSLKKHWYYAIIDYTKLKQFENNDELIIIGKVDEYEM